MSMKRLVNEIKEMRDEISCSWIGRLQRKRATRRGRAHIAPEAAAAAALGSGSSSDPLALCVSWCDLSEDERRRRSSSSSTWANMPPELLHSIIKRVEGGQTSWPGRRDVVACASVCKSWRQITKDAVQTPEQCGCLTFPISLKQPGPRDAPIQCFIKRDRATSTYRLYLGLSPALSGDMSKLLLAAKKIRRATCTEFQISFVSGDFCQTSNTYVGKLRSNFLGTKFTIYDSQPPHPAMQSNCKKNRRIHSIKVSPQVQAVNYDVGAISYELNILRTRGPRRIGCTVQSIPISAIQEGGTAPTPMDFTSFHDEQFHSTSTSKSRQPLVEFSSISLADLISGKREPLVLKNKAPRWHEQLQCWCLNFKGRVTVASVKNFQLVAAVEPCQNVPTEEQEKVILQFGKIGKDIFTMDYRYPLSAFQAFAVCLSSFDTKPACE